MFLNGYPYTDFHEMNLDFLLKSMETLKQAFADFTASNSLIFAEPLLFDITKSYAKNTIVLNPDGNAYISLQAVPEGVQLSNADYWLMVFNFEDYTEKANKNFTVNYFRDTTRAPYSLSVGDWCVLDDVLYTVTQAIAADELFVIGTNLTHFTVEQFLKDFTTSIVQTVNQYKNDIDASELLYRQQLAQDIANTTASLQAQLDAVIAGVTVDSEVIDARVSADSITYSSLGKAIRTVTAIERLFPFAGSTDTKLLHPNTSASVYDTGSAGIKKLKILAKTPAAYKDYYVLNLYAYHASLHTSLFTVRSSDNAITFNYQSAARPDPSNLPTEDITVTGSDGSVLTATIDWSKINTANGVNIPNNTAGFKIFDGCVEFMPDTSIARLYPFDVPLDTILKHPSSLANVYSVPMAGIQKLHIDTADDGEFYLTNLYSYHAGAHTSLLSIANKNNAVTFIYQSAVRPDPSNLPTEDITVTGSDGSVLTATIDWSKINTANGVNIPLGSDGFRISESCITREHGYCRFAPIDDYYVSDAQQRLYMNEIAEYNKDGYFTFSFTGATNPEVTTNSNDNGQFIEFNMTGTKDVTVVMNYFYNFTKIASHTITVHANTTATLPAKKYMFIGDSLTDAAVYIKEFIDLNTGLVTSYGTRQTLGIDHEGRAGWSSSNYVNDASHGGVTNPFYNTNTSEFDFSFYMANNPSFSDVDCVVIFLGRNDGYTSSAIANIKTMLDSILDYNSNIKTFVIGAYNVPDNNTGLGKALQYCQSLNHGANNYNRRFFYTEFDQTTTTKPISVELNLDNEYDYSVTSRAISIVDSRTREEYVDTVHPSSIGYKKFGYAISSYFRNFFA